MPQLSPDAQAALDVANSLLSSIKVGGKAGQAQFTECLHPLGTMSHARYSRGKGVFFTDFARELPEYVHEAWQEGSDMEETIDGEATVLCDHDVAMVWTPYWFRRNQELTHVGTNCFNLLKVTEDNATEPKGDWGSSECNWKWMITVLNDTARPATSEEKKRLDEEYASDERRR